MIGFLIYGPWLQITNKYDAAFQAQPRLVPKAWCILISLSSRLLTYFLLWLGSRFFRSHLLTQAPGFP
jgi:hypothetical protein